jgi:hypothetical protein
MNERMNKRILRVLLPQRPTKFKLVIGTIALLMIIGMALMK